MPVETAELDAAQVQLPEARLNCIHSARDSMEAHFLVALLENGGISAEVTGDVIALMRGKFPFDCSTLPAVWIRQADQPEAALVMLDASRDAHMARERRWVCPQCGKSVGGQFSSCWNCLAERAPAGDDPFNGKITLTRDLTCGGCGYNLRGLAESDECPECGLPIRATLVELRCSLPRSGRGRSVIVLIVIAFMLVILL